MSFRASIVFPLLFIAFPTQAAELQGVVLENEVNGRPAERIGVDAIGANRAETDSSGKFTLRFPAKRPGDPVRVIISKPGHVVVNDVQLETVLLANPDDKPLLVLVCRTSDREEMARRYFRLRVLDAIEDNYVRQLQKLEVEKAALGADYERRLRSLETERNSARSGAENMAMDLAKGKPGESSELRRDALRLFLDGKVEGAIQLLDKDKLHRLRTVARRQKEGADRELEENAQAWMLRAQMFILQFRFDDAADAIQEAIEAAPDDFLVNFQFGLFNQQLNRYQEARKAYDRTLEIARRGKRDKAIAFTLNNLGVLNNDQNRPDDARKAYEEALQIYRELERQTPQSCLADLAGTLDNIGVLERGQNRPDDARKAYEEALQIRRELARQNPTYLYRVADTLNNLGVLDLDQHRVADARKDLVEALQIRRELARQNPQTHLHHLADTLLNLGLLDRDQIRMADARKDLDEALQIFRQLAQRAPETYLPDVANSLNTIGLLDADQGRMDDAQKTLGEALQIFRELARQNPQTYLPRVAGTLSNLGDVHRAQGRRDGARKAFDEALTIYERFAARDPQQFKPDVAHVKGRLAGLGRWRALLGCGAAF